MKPDTLIRIEGMRALRERLGLVEAERFIVLIRRETFDYTEWQRNLWVARSLDEIFQAAKIYSEKHSCK